MFTDLETLCVGRESTIHQAIARMEVNRIGIVLVVDEDGRLSGTITDGDVRRAVLANVDLGQAVTVLLDRKEGSPYARPITAPQGSDRTALLRVLKEHRILHLPLVDSDQRVVGLVTLDEFVGEHAPPPKAVIMAGGPGVRLLPLTKDLPKPMLPVGNKPLMEILVQQLRDAGIRRLNITVHHQSEKIIEHFGDGREFGVDITYSTEDRPLGTAGALGMIEAPQETVLVVNGDILTGLDFRAMLAYHREQCADLTVAVQRYEVQVPYGVIECEGAFVRRLAEKPVLGFVVNAGIYLLEPSVHRLIPAGERYDMTELIQRLLDEGRPVAPFPIREYWLDIGQHADYERAQEYMNHWKPAS